MRASASRRRAASDAFLKVLPREGQAFTKAVIASVMAAAAAKIERIAEIAFMALSCGSLPIEETKSRI